MKGRSDGGGGGGGGVGGGAGSSSRFISQIFWPEHCLSLGEDVCWETKTAGCERGVWGAALGSLLLLLHKCVVYTLACGHGMLLLCASLLARLLLAGARC